MNSRRDDGAAAESWIYEVGPEEPFSVAVVCTVADVAGRDPLDLPELLCDAVDVDAMEAMFSAEKPAAAGNLELSFLYCGYSVRVTAETVELRERETVDR